MFFSLKEHSSPENKVILIVFIIDFFFFFFFFFFYCLVFTTVSKEIKVLDITYSAGVEKLLQEEKEVISTINSGEGGRLHKLLHSREWTA